MRSPINPNVKMASCELEPGLAAFRCPESGGTYIPQANYWKWLHSSKPEMPDPALPEGYQPEQAAPSATRRALLCPESGRIMTRYRVGHGLDFSIDRSPTGGIWLDQGEWEALRAHGLHRELHYIFTSSYQHKRIDEEADAKLREHFRERIGADRLEKADEFRDWLAAQPNAWDILCYVREGIGKD